MDLLRGKVAYVWPMRCSGIVIKTKGRRVLVHTLGKGGIRYPKGPMVWVNVVDIDLWPVGW